LCLLKTWGSWSPCPPRFLRPCVFQFPLDYFHLQYLYSHNKYSGVKINSLNSKVRSSIQC
jgi:hypothetical protein